MNGEFAEKRVKERAFGWVRFGGFQALSLSVKST